MQENGVATDVVIPEVLTRMRQFTQMNKLKKNALKVCHYVVLKCVDMAGQQIYILALSASLNPHLFPTSDQVLL
jgi:hypothetical protein